MAINIPRPYIGNPLFRAPDFSPINNVLAGIENQRRHNALMDVRREESALAQANADRSHQLEQDSLGLARDQFNADQTNAPLRQELLRAQIAEARRGNRPWWAGADGSVDPAMQAYLDAERAGKAPVISEVEKARQRAVGASIGKGQVNAAANYSTAKRLLDSTGTLIADPNLPRMTGMINQYRPNISDASRATQARMDQVKAQTFLLGFERLKGGGAISDEEGRAAANALAKLDPSMGYEAYKMKLLELRAIAQRGLETAIAQQQGRLPQIPNEKTPSVKTKVFNGKTYVQDENGNWFEQ